MSSSPLLSIIVPSYNQGSYLERTLRSIFEQDYRPIEVLVIDGASSDDSVAILERFAGAHPELRWWSEPDKGVVDAVNKGIARASGVYAGIQSSDDLYRPGAFSEAVEALQQHPDVGVVCADCDIIDEHDRLLCPAPGARPFSQEGFLARAMIMHQSSSFFVLDRVRAAGGWRDDYYCADTDLWLRLSFQTRFLKLPRCWSAWRKHEAQRDKEARRMWQDWGRMIRESADLQRAPLRLRLAAAAGRRMLAIDYNPAGSEFFRWWNIWLAIALYPPSIRAVYRYDMLAPPGLEPLAQAILRLRRRWRRAS